MQLWKVMLVTGAAAAHVAGLPAGDASADGAARPNILFIIVDDLRPEMDCYGVEKMVTPNLDRLAERGVRFIHLYHRGWDHHGDLVALLFALYEVKPSPFCVLDELDAPLDDANIGRFLEVVKHFMDKTQFVIVTHNKKTMEAADRLFGVTMEEEGVSKMVSVRFEEAA